MAHPLQQWIPRLSDQQVVVVGDVILDEYLTGKTTRLSREAPIPVLEFESRQVLPGGAANPAANITALGSKAIQLGVIGSDPEAQQLRETLEAKSIDARNLISDATRPTTVKTRVMAHMGLRFPQQVARLDKLSREPISTAIEHQILDAITAITNPTHAFLLSDYHTGLLTDTLVKSIRSVAQQKGVLLTADAQGELDKYTGFGLVKCNADEARSYLRRDLQTDRDFNTAAVELYQSLELAGGMVITRGGDGATVATDSKQAFNCPAPAVSDVYDTVGAGDTTIAVLTLAIGGGASYEAAATLANYASGLVVRRVGNYTPSPDELAWALDTWG